MSLAFGLTVALGWGTGDFLAALFGRRIGTFRTVLVMQLIAVVVLALYLPFDPLPALSLPVLAGTAGTGLLALVTYGFLYRGLALGPVAVVSPLSACYALVAILLTVAFLGVRPAAPTWVGFGLTLGGIVLVSTNLRELRVGLCAAGRGVGYGVAGMVGLGVVVFLLAVLGERIGWFAPVFLMRAVAGLVIAAVALAAPRRWVTAGASSGSLLAATSVGVADTMGWLAAGAGVTLGDAAVTAAASACYPLIPVVLGVVVLGEHLVPNQWWGIGLIVGGLLIVGLSG